MSAGVLHKKLVGEEFLCNSAGAMKRSPSKELPLKGQWKLPFEAPANHSVRREYRKCGADNCRTCREGPGHGPYLYAFWREGSKVKRKYLGQG